MPSPPLPLVQSLSPRIAVLSSEDVVQSCEANGCRGLEELLRPWEGSTERVSILSSTLIPTIHPTFPLRLISFDAILPNPGLSAPPGDMVVDLISGFVGVKRPDEEQQYPLTRSLLLSSRPLAAHETFNHPVGILFAVSTAEPDPMSSMKRLTQQLLGSAQTIPWMDAVNLMKFFVVVHDVGRAGEDLASANELLASVKKLYGPHSTLLVINSQLERRAPPPSPDVATHPTIPLPRALTPDDTSLSAISQIYATALSSLTLSPLTATAAAIGEPLIRDTPATPSRPVRRKLYGSKLTGEDTQRLAALVRELVVQSLIPWMEARVREWNEVYHSNRRGITGRLFGAGRKFFGSRPASPAQTAQAGYNVVKGYYPVTAIESLSRRLADFAFMLRDYRFAASVYDSLRRDFAQDRANRYAAAATEMYGLSLLLSHSYFQPTTPPRPPSSPFTTLQHTDISSWLEQAVLTYTANAQGLQLDALRATILYYEAWKMIGEWRGVGTALVRAAGDAEEVAAAVIIEEAAQADLRGGKEAKGLGRRRRAFNLVLAARRYETAGMKSYSRRCLTRAAELYRSTPWTAAQDRIEYSLGRQAYASGEMDQAVLHFLSLLGGDVTGVPGSQSGPLEDMGLAYQQLMTHPKQLAAVQDKLILPTPIFDVARTRLVTPTTTNAASGSGSGSASKEAWTRLETLALDIWDRKGKKPMRLLPDTSSLVVAAGDTFYVELRATNPLNATLELANLQLSLESADGSPSDITPEAIPGISLEAYETRLISIPVTAISPCSLSVRSIDFLFHALLPCSQPLAKRGPRLHATKEQRINPTYGQDRSLQVAIVPEGARLGVTVEQVEGEVWVGEERTVQLRLKNEGRVKVGGIQLVLDQAEVMALGQPEGTGSASAAVSIPNTIPAEQIIPLDDIAIDPGEESVVSLSLRPLRPGPLQILGLVLYSSIPAQDEAADTPVLSSTFEVAAGVWEAMGMSCFIRDTHSGTCALLEISNQCGEPMRLHEVCALSAYWKPTAPALVGSPVLLPNQTFRLQISIEAPKAVPTGIDLYQANVVGTLSQLLQNKPLPSGPTESNAVNLTSSKAFSPALIPPYIASRASHCLNQLRADFPSLTTQQIRRIFPLFPPLEVDVVVRWSTLPHGPSPNPAPTPGRRGMSALHALQPFPAFSTVNALKRQVALDIANGSKQTRTMYEETSRIRRVLVDSVLEGVFSHEDNPVEVRMGLQDDSNNGDGPGEGSVHTRKRKGRGWVGVDLDKLGGGVALKVNVEVRNRSPAVPARWILSLLSPSGSTQHSGEPSPAPAHWMGQLSHSGTLSPNSFEVVQVSIWVTQPGLISLAGWMVEVETGEPSDPTAAEENGKAVGGISEDSASEVLNQDSWIPRQSWRRYGMGGIIEVVDISCEVTGSV